MNARLILLLIIVSISGCASTRSTFLHRDESDQCWQADRLLDGVPITVHVPTHIKVDITEHHYLGLFNAKHVSEIDDRLNFATGDIQWVSEDAQSAPERSVTHQLIKTAKIFTVDPKRPAAGDIDATLDFGGKDGQYFDKIDYKVDDKTIKAIEGLLGNVAKSGLFGAPTTDRNAPKVDDINKLLHRVDNVVASCIFNLEAPDVEHQIAEFLETHLNRCHSCDY